MSNTDFLNALGVGASFKTTELVTALVDAERASRIKDQPSNRNFGGTDQWVG